MALRLEVNGNFLRTRRDFLKHEAEYFLRDRRIPYGRKRLPVEWRGPMFTESRDVMRCAVSLVGRETIHGENWIPCGDHSIALYLGDDRRGCDRSGKRVSMNNRKLRKVAVDADGVGE